MITRSYVKCCPNLLIIAESMSFSACLCNFSVFKTVEMCMYVISGDKLLHFYQTISPNYSICRNLPPYLCISLPIPTLFLYLPHLPPSLLLFPSTSFPSFPSPTLLSPLSLPLYLSSPLPLFPSTSLPLYLPILILQYRTTFYFLIVMLPVSDCVGLCRSVSTSYHVLHSLILLSRTT